MADSRATEDVLALLHGAVAETLLDRIKSGEATAADINAAIKFLKDNGIDCVGSANSRMQEIEESLNGLPSTFLSVPGEDEVRILQ